MGHLWLVGMMGSGKSVVGRLAAARLGVPFVDTDDEVESRLGCSIAEWWEQAGEAAFRDAEAAELAVVAAGPDAVVATGGGVVVRRDNVDVMRRTGTVVWLTAPIAELAERVGAGEGRPLVAADGPAVLTELLEDRRAAYAAAAGVTLETAGREPADIAEEVVGLWNAS